MTRTEEEGAAAAADERDLLPVFDRAPARRAAVVVIFLDTEADELPSPSSADDASSSSSSSDSADSESESILGATRWIAEVAVVVAVLRRSGRTAGAGRSAGA